MVANKRIWISFGKVWVQKSSIYEPGWRSYSQKFKIFRVTPSWSMDPRYASDLGWVKGSPAILFLKSMSERGGSDILRLWIWIFNRFWVDLEIHHSISESLFVGSDSSDIDFKNKMVWVWTTLKFQESSDLVKDSPSISKKEFPFWVPAQKLKTRTSFDPVRGFLK